MDDLTKLAIPVLEKRDKITLLTSGKGAINPKGVAVTKARDTLVDLEKTFDGAVREELGLKTDSDLGTADTEKLEKRKGIILADARAYMFADNVLKSQDKLAAEKKPLVKHDRKNLLDRNKNYFESSVRESLDLKTVGTLDKSDRIKVEKRMNKILDEVADRNKVGHGDDAPGITHRRSRQR